MTAVWPIAITVCHPNQICSIHLKIKNKLNKPSIASAFKIRRGIKFFFSLLLCNPLFNVLIFKFVLMEIFSVAKDFHLLVKF